MAENLIVDNKSFPLENNLSISMAFQVINRANDMMPTEVISFFSAPHPPLTYMIIMKRMLE